jgi:hypothetical protein
LQLLRLGETKPKQKRKGFEEATLFGKIKAKDTTYGKVKTTMFDVWEDLNHYNQLNLKVNRDGRASKRVLAMRAIAQELRQRMSNANRTLPEALGDLEVARRKSREKGGAGTVAALVAAIRLKNGKRVDPRRKTPILEY